MAELRAVSSRATISPTSFVNQYQWGDFKGDPKHWMKRYFDAFVYTANWCECRFALKLSHGLFKKADLLPYMIDGALTVAHTRTHWILEWALGENDDSDRFNQDDGAAWMGRLVGLREELMQGDLRPLYLGWLAGVIACDVEEDALEPPVPAGISCLSPAQQALVEFLDINRDLLEVALAGSAQDDAWRDDDTAEVSMAGLSRQEMRIVFGLVLHGEVQQAERRVKSGFQAWQRKNGAPGAVPAARRTVGQLLGLAAAVRERRLAQLARDQARHEQNSREKREAELRAMAGKAGQIWETIHQHAERATAASYEEAERALVDLRQACALVAKSAEFDRLLGRFMTRYCKRRALMRRLAAAGMSTQAF